MSMTGIEENLYLDSIAKETSRYRIESDLAFFIDNYKILQAENDRLRRENSILKEKMNNTNNKDHTR